MVLKRKKNPKQNNEDQKTKQSVFKSKLESPNVFNVKNSACGCIRNIY